MIAWSGRCSIILVIAAFFAALTANAAEVSFHDHIGGMLQTVTVQEGQSLLEVARAHDIGYNGITSANPRVDPFVPDPGTKVVLPTAWILPEAQAHAGIVINVAEMRLYLLPRHHGDRVETFPVGIGDEGWDTPLGSYTIIEKIEKPAWHVPASIRAQKPELPEVVPPGPNNPLGSHALRLSIGSVLIHGTDRPFGIGMRVSHGCIHLYPEDIAKLFRMVPVGTRVEIVNQPVKAAVSGGRVLVEVHGDGKQNLEQEARALLEKRGIAEKVDPQKLRAALLSQSGVLMDVTSGPEPGTYVATGESGTPVRKMERRDVAPSKPVTEAVGVGAGGSTGPVEPAGDRAEPLQEELRRALLGEESARE